MFTYKRDGIQRYVGTHPENENDTNEAHVFGIHEDIDSDPTSAPDLWGASLYYNGKLTQSCRRTSKKAAQDWCNRGGW